MSRGSALAALALVAALAPGCRYLSFWPRAIAACPGALRPVDEIPGPRTLQLRMHVRSAEVETALRVAVERREDEIAWVGLSPLGALLFSAIQRGDALADEEALPAAVLEVPPENVVRDVHRVLFREADREDGPRRSFEDGDAGTVVVDLDPAPAEGLLAATVRHPRCGYEATIVILSDSKADSKTD